MTAEARDPGCSGAAMVQKLVKSGERVLPFMRYTQNLPPLTFKASDRILQVGIDQRRSTGYVPRVVDKDGKYTLGDSIRRGGNMTLFALEAVGSRVAWVARSDVTSTRGDSNVRGYQTSAPPTSMRNQSFKFRVIVDAGVSDIYEQTFEVVPTSCNYVKIAS